MQIAPRFAVLLIACVALVARGSAHAGVVAEETTAIDFLQMIAMDSRVIASIEGDKARLDITIRMKAVQSSVDDDDESMRTTEIQRLDRGVVYSLIEPARQYRESTLAGQATPTDSSRQIAAIANGLKCQWNTAQVAMKNVGREVVGGTTTAHVRIDTSRRCVPAVPTGSSCTLGLTYDQWSAEPNALQAQFARYRRDYAATAGKGSGPAEEFALFSQFGVPVDPILVESIRTAVASAGLALKTNAVLRASRSCFVPSEDAGDTPNDPSTQSDAPLPLQFVSAMLLSAWAAEKDSQTAEGSADRAEILGTITTELKTIRAQEFSEDQFELPAGFTRIF